MIDNLVGVYEKIRVDEKGRIILPSDFEPCVGEKLKFIFRNDYIEVWPSENFSGFLKELRVISLINPSGEIRVSAKRCISNFTVHAGHGNVRSQRKVTLGVDKISHYAVKGYVTIEGQIDHIRVWNPNSFAKYKAANESLSPADKELLASVIAGKRGK